MSKSCISHQCPRYATCQLGKLEDPKEIPKEMCDYVHQVTGSNTLGDPIYACGPAGDYKMYVPGPGVVVGTIESTRPAISHPSRICAVCEATEYKGAEIIKDEFWMCPDCLSILKRVVQERTNNPYYLMKHHD